MAEILMLSLSQVWTRTACVWPTWTARERLDHARWVGRDPAWSPDGTLLAYAGPDGVYLLVATGSEHLLWPAPPAKPGGLYSGEEETPNPSRWPLILRPQPWGQWRGGRWSRGSVG